MTLTYSEAESLLSKARDMNAGKPVQNHTRLFKRGEDYAVRLHSTDVVTVHPDGTYTLNAGGWYTVTTKERINSYGPARVSSAGANAAGGSPVWCVWHKSDPVTEPKVRKCRACKGAGCWHCGDSGTRDYGSKANPVRFYDGIVVDSDGKVTDPDAPRLYDHSLADDANAATLAAIKRYVAGLTDAKISELWYYATTEGTGGDCWFCSMFDAAGARDDGHLMSHIQLGDEAEDEPYYLATLIRNALTDRGYREPLFIFQLGADMRSHRDAERIREDVARYLRKRLVKGRPVR